MTQLAVNEMWYVKLPGATSLTKVTIYDITELTVEVVPHQLMAHSSRYKRDEIEFVERTEP